MSGTGRESGEFRNINRPGGKDGLTVEMDRILQLIPYMVALILSLSVHEFAHAWSADLLGDDTAAQMGRKTLDPTAHIDPIGTLVFPIIGFFFPGAPLFGWAKPVPVNPVRFTRRVSMDWGMAITAAAGPLSNVALALAASLIHFVLMLFNMEGETLNRFLILVLSMNVSLAFFNLIPVPPLDGGRIFTPLVPEAMRDSFRNLEQYGMIILYALLFTGAIGVVFKYVVTPVAVILWRWPALFLY